MALPMARSVDDEAGSTEWAAIHTMLGSTTTRPAPTSTPNALSDLPTAPGRRHPAGRGLVRQFLASARTSRHKSGR
eukprot:scaffold2082_cov111-Isochrysis_galbana.AAC.2